MTHETAFLTLLSGDEWVPVSQEESPLNLRQSMRLGAPLPLHCGAGGKAILALMPEKFTDRILGVPLRAFGPQSITDPYRLRSDLQIAREMGYSAGDEELTSGAAGVCSPVFNYQGQVVGSIGVGVPKVRLSPERRLELGEVVRAAAASLSRELGYSLTFGEARRETEGGDGVSQLAVGAAGPAGNAW